MIGACGGGWRTSRAPSESRRPPPLAQRSDDPGFASPASRFRARRVWWQWTTWPRGVMTDIGRTARPDLLVAGDQDLDGLLGPLVAYLHALEARVGALERRLSAVPLMTAADAVRLRQCGDDPARGPRRRARGSRLCRPLTPDLSRCPQQLACHQIICGGTGLFAAPPASRAKGKRCRRGGVAGAGVNVARQLGTVARSPLDPYGHVIDELDHAPRLAAVDAIMQGAQRPASGASGSDRIVGVMSASGSYDAVPSNCGRGATTGPPGCSPPVLSSPLPQPPSRRFAGIKCELGGLEGTKGFPDKEEVPGSSPGSPTPILPAHRHFSCGQMAGYEFLDARRGCIWGADATSSLQRGYAALPGSPDRRWSPISRAPRGGNEPLAGLGRRPRGHHAAGDRLLRAC